MMQITSKPIHHRRVANIHIHVVYLIGNSNKEVNNAVFTAYKALRSLESVILLLKTPKIGPI
jgi:hypothetical protein